MSMASPENSLESHPPDVKPLVTNGAATAPVAQSSAVNTSAQTCTPANAGRTPLSVQQDLASQRPYRSRHQPPCQRCRSRKQRCITRPNGTCINCQIAGTPCIINTLKRKASASSANKDDGANSQSVSASRRRRTASSVQPLADKNEDQSIQAPLSRDALPQPLPTAHYNTSHSPFGYTFLPVPSTSGFGATFADALSVYHEHTQLLLSSTAASEGNAADEDDSALRPLDADADDDFEPHYVGRTAERDALVLSAVMHVVGRPPPISNGIVAVPRPLPYTPNASLRVRQVSTDPAEPMFFLFERTQPYGDYDNGARCRALLDQLLDLVGRANVPRLLAHYRAIDGVAIPVWSPAHFRGDPSAHVPPGLLCAYISRGIIHDEKLRPTLPRAWQITLHTINLELRRARLATVQAGLLDLDGRPSLDPTGNSLTLGQTIAAARLMGLHLDCSKWTIPRWEKSLRIRLWWALLQQDKWSALCCGRSSYIHLNDWNVPLPTVIPSRVSPPRPMSPIHIPERSPKTDNPSDSGSTHSSSGQSPHAHSPHDRFHAPPPYPAEEPLPETFVALCELTLILDRILSALHSVRRPSPHGLDGSLGTEMGASRGSCTPKLGAGESIRHLLSTITSFGFELDAWSRRLDALRAKLPQDRPLPGLRSLELSYYAVALLLARSTFDVDLPASILRGTQESALKITEQVIQFTSSLTISDLKGYWANYTAFHFSTCLVLLIRLVLQSDINDQSDNAVWQRALHQLHVFIAALSNAKHAVPSFELADLALARARHLIPQLTQRIPELEVVLAPFKGQTPGPVSVDGPAPAVPAVPASVPASMSAAAAAVQLALNPISLPQPKPSATPPLVSPPEDLPGELGAGWGSMAVDDGLKMSGGVLRDEPSIATGLHNFDWSSLPESNFAVLDAFFPHVAEPDRAALKDFLPDPHSYFFSGGMGLDSVNGL
ncbi:hypothetical protein FISHEDRAFT_71632 [Fistulina hepatica ATCC 64428]|uniref:Zn(2)-C6 fungal-type domain-containing protein n=1 Tax=Fistulina hepatica ATCC 64428 TaxID=1128425 RepID=A0A0D7AGN3_9AGAR|nr:hypothetical protein FISHEDRAFT_71632 [Fistulina hepatica ATCC 64428]